MTGGQVIAFPGAAIKETSSVDDSCVQALLDIPLIIAFDDQPRARIVAQFDTLMDALTNDPRLGARCVDVLMPTDSATSAARDLLDDDMTRRVRAALGPGAWPEVVLAVQWIMLSGFALVLAGGASREQVVTLLTDAVRVLAPDPREVSMREMGVHR